MNKEQELDFLDDLEDFDLTEATYQVWTFDLDKHENVISDWMLKEYNNPEEAIEFAKNIVKSLQATDKSKLTKVAACEVVVETVVDFGDYDENVGTLFREVVEF